MKKRILSIMLVLTFILCAIPAGLNAAEVGDGSKMADWTAKIGTIEALSDGVFTIKAFDSTQPNTLTNKMQVRQVMYNGEYDAATISVTFDTASIMAGRGDGKSGGNDQGIIFGGSGIKAYGADKTNYNAADIEKESCFYFLHFTNNRLILANVNKDFKDANGAVKPYKSLASVDLSTTIANAWTGMKQEGKVTVTVTYGGDGAIEVFVGPNRIEKLCQEAGTCLPYGGEIGIRTGMGYHVPTHIYDASIVEYVAPPAVPADWSAKAGTISGLNEETGAFQIDTGTHARQAMWAKYLKSGKIEMTFDVTSILAKRAPTAATNPGAGSNDTGFIFGGLGIHAATANNVNNIENVSQYYCLMMSNETLQVCKVDRTNTTVNDKGQTVPKAWVGVIKNPETQANLSVNVKDVIGADAWATAQSEDKLTLALEFTEAGAIQVWVNDTLATQLCSGDGTCVPFGAEVGVRAGMGYHVPTKILEWEITGDISDYAPEETPDEPGDDTPGDDVPGDDTPGDDTPSDDTPGNDTGNNDNDSLKPNVNNGSNANNTASDDNKDEEKDNTLWIIIGAACAGLVVIGVVLALVLGKKKKA